MAKVAREMAKESVGWIGIVVVMVAFPTLFFLCAFFPIWMGWAPRWGM